MFGFPKGPSIILSSGQARDTANLLSRAAAALNNEASHAETLADTRYEAKKAVFAALEAISIALAKL